MPRHFVQVPGARKADSGTRGRVAAATAYSSLVRPSLLALLLGCLSLGTGCSPLQSSVGALVAGEPPADPTYAGRQHFPVTPNEAVECLIEIAPQEGWEVVSAGEEYSARGASGTFFRLAPVEPSGDKRTLSGVFYAEPSGSYVRVSEENGLPEPLVEPLIAEMRKRRRDREQ